MEKQRNPVAKNAKKFNKASVQRDRKKDQKRGYKVKHKNKLYASTTPPVGEGLKVSDGMPAWIKDFQKSDAPQFQGKSDEKRKQMAIAAYMDAKGGDMKEVKEPTGDLKDACWKGYTAVGTKKKNGKTVPNCVPKEDTSTEEGYSPDTDPKRKNNKVSLTKSDKTKMAKVAKMMDREKNRKQNQSKRVAQRAIVKKHKFANKNPKEDSGKVSGIDGSKRVGTKIVPKYIPKKDAVITISADNSDVSELSNATLSRYKTKAAKQASAADKAGNFKKADKRFSGITRATNKQFKNDAKKESAVDRDKTKSYIPPGVSAVKEELDKMKKRKHMNLKRRAKSGDRSAVTQLRQFEKDHAKDLEKKPRTAKQISKGSGSAQDSNLIVQLRKSQDSGGKHAIEVGGGKKVKLDKKTVDNLLKQYDGMKPDSKRKWQVVATKKLRSMAK